MKEKIKEEAQYINERFYNAPLAGRALRLISTMKTQHGEIISYEECMRALTSGEEE